MVRFVIRRLVLIPIALIAVSLFGFAYAHAAQRANASASPFIAQRVSATPVLEDYAQTVAGLLGGAPLLMPGTQEGRPLLEAVLAVAGNSLGLLALAFGLSVALGLALGLAAVRTGSSRVAGWVLPVSSLAMAMPAFFVGAIGIAASIAVLSQQGPDAQPLIPFSGFGWDLHLVLPVAALVLHPALQIAQITAALLAGETGKPYVVAAKSFGHAWRAIRWRHMLRNVAAPVVLTIAGCLRLLVAELIVVEWLFGWPGLGRLLAWTLIPPRLSNDPGAPLFLFPPAIALAFTLLALVFLLADLAASLLVQAFDPRLRVHDEDKERAAHA